MKGRKEENWQGSRRNRVQNPQLRRWEGESDQRISADVRALSRGVYDAPALRRQTGIVGLIAIAGNKLRCRMSVRDPLKKMVHTMRLNAGQECNE